MHCKNVIHLNKNNKSNTYKNKKHILLRTQDSGMFSGDQHRPVHNTMIISNWPSLSSYLIFYTHMMHDEHIMFVYL